MASSAQVFQTLILKRRRAGSAMISGLAAAMLIGLSPSQAQDIPGIENCTAEKAMDRRTSCLQSNVNYLKATITQLQQVSFSRIDAANRQIAALRASVIALQATVAELQAAANKKPAAPGSKNETPKNEPAKKQ